MSEAHTLRAYGGSGWMAAVMVAMAMPAFAESQPQSGQPGLTEGQNGPPPYP
jgi:hypothetical protein